jgi:hypothetical protein
MVAQNLPPHEGPHRIFWIPELLRAIFDHLEPYDYQLRAVCLVNTTWAELGLDIHWSSTSETSLLRVGLLTAPSRRQFYASKVVRLTLDRCLAFLARLEFPRLLHVDYMFPDGESAVEYHANVQTWLPRSVSSLSFSDGSDPFSSPNMLVFYAQLRALQELRFLWLDMPYYDRITAAMIERVSASVRDPFARLRLLEAVVDAGALRLLAPMLRRNARITHLKLVISGKHRHDAVLPKLAKLETLTSLSVHLLLPTALANDHILTLRQLRLLRTLEVSGKGLRAPSFGDKELALLLADLGQLRTFTWSMRCAVSAAALPLIGASLPQLYDLDIPVSFQLRALDNFNGSAPLFPMLYWLSVNLFDDIRSKIPSSCTDDDEIS